MPNFDFNVTDYACYSLSHSTAWMLFFFFFFWVCVFFIFFLVKTNYSQNGLIHFSPPVSFPVSVSEPPHSALLCLSKEKKKKALV